MKKMERLDKIIVSQTNYSRKDAKNLVRSKKIRVNDNVVIKSDMKVDVYHDRISIDGVELDIKKYVYLVLYKPKGYISATEDKNMMTVLDLVPEEYLHRNLFPVGRLDKDTTGLMIITDDGDFAHDILAPKKHIKKLYEVVVDRAITEEMVDGFKNGVVLNDGECKEAELQITGINTGIVTLIEGRYHQIKRMFGCYKAKVLELHRIGMGNLMLPVDLEMGECRELTEEELKRIKDK